jgi:sn1-specific diacylglycerol lipase
MEPSLVEEVICQKCGGKHAGKCRIDKVIAALSVSLSQVSRGATRWSISDTTAGLLKLHKRHTQEGAVDSIKGVVCRDRAELKEMLDWLRWATAAYEKDRHTLVTSMQLRDRDVARMVVESAFNKPAYFIAVYHAKKYVVVSIRGTYNTTDILTDLNPHNEAFQQGAAHSGMLGAAKWLLEKEGPLLKRLLADNPGYMLALTGHSLGAAVAGLVAMMVHSSSWSWFLKTSLGILPSQIICWGFGCAPCVDRRLAEATKFYVRNVVLQDDVVPRLNPAAIEALRDEIQATTLLHLKDGKTKKVMESIESLKLSSGMQSAMQVGASVYQKLQEARVQCGCPLLGTSSTPLLIEDKSITSRDGPETDAGIAAKAIVTVAKGPGHSKQELEQRRLFVPGRLYHIRRQKTKREERMTSIPVPARPFQAGEEAPRGSKFKHYVICGTDPAARFGRIILSSTLLSDHGCFNIRDSILDAMQHCT